MKVLIGLIYPASSRNDGPPKKYQGKQDKTVTNQTWSPADRQYINQAIFRIWAWAQRVSDNSGSLIRKTARKKLAGIHELTKIYFTINDGL